MKVGKQSLTFANVYLNESAVVAGPKEKEGPLKDYFDKTIDDLYHGQKSWEKAEMEMFKNALDICVDKSGLNKSDIDMIVCGDLNNQMIIGNYVLRDYDISHLGVFSACATSMESIIIASAFVDSNNKNNVIAGTSSHVSTAERQFRYPTEYGGMKPESITSTATAAGVAIISKRKSAIKITKATIGKIIDGKMTDVSDMGRAMAPAAYDTIKQHFSDFNTDASAYDLIVTGDLSYYGKNMVNSLFAEDGITLSNYDDCGLILYDRDNQDVAAGGSGCGCCAAVTFSYLVDKLKVGTYKKILVVSTGALHNPVIVLQKESIPGVAHAVVLERIES